MNFPRNLRSFACSATLIFSLFFIVPSAAVAQMFAGYDSFCGLPVIVQPTPQRAEATYNSAGQQIIVLDPSVYSNQTASRIFAIAHECAHHRNGHTSGLGPFKRFHDNGTAAQERGADCWAAERLALAGLTSEIERAIRDFADEPDQPFWSPYPEGYERAVTVWLCANRAGAKLPPYGDIVDGVSDQSGDSSDNKLVDGDDPCAPANRERYFFIVCVD